MEEDERERGASRERAVGFRLVVILAVDVPYSKKSPSVKRRTRGDRERERERERVRERERRPKKGVREGRRMEYIRGILNNFWRLTGATMVVVEVVGGAGVRQGPEDFVPWGKEKR